MLVVQKDDAHLSVSLYDVLSGGMLCDANQSGETPLPVCQTTVNLYF